MSALVLIVTGPPASGKTTIGRALAHRLALPFLSKDLFKETLYDTLGWSDEEWSRRLGMASMVLLFRSAEALLEAGESIVLEAPFYPQWDTARFREMAQRFDCRFVQVVCTASGPTLVERYTRRIGAGERHPGHAASDVHGTVLQRLLAETWDALELDGPVLHVDTEGDEAVDVQPLAEQIVSLRRTFGVARRRAQ
jgi:predicted kinase